MATNEELLDILLQIRATGQAEAASVNALLEQTGNVSATSAPQIQALTAAQAAHNDILQTAESFTSNYGGALTAQEERYARLQLSTIGATTAERDFTSIGGDAARAMGSLGEQSARTLDRFSALAGAMGAGGIAGLAVGGALVAGGAVLEVGKSLADNADQNEAAQKSLEQAFASQHQTLADHQSQIDGLIKTNAGYITSTYEAKDAIASITRAGLDWTQTQRLFNDAIDLSAAKGISLTDATKDLIDAEQGRSLGLIDLGISVKTTTDYQAALTKDQKELTTATTEHTKAVRELTIWEDNHHDRSVLTAADLLREQGLQEAVTASAQKMATAHTAVATAQADLNAKGDKFNQVLDQVEKKTDGARGNVSQLQQDQHRLNTDFQSFSDQIGPGVNTALDGLVNAADGAVNALSSLYGALSSDLSELQAWDNAQGIYSTNPAASAAAARARGIGSGAQPFEAAASLYAQGQADARAQRGGRQGDTYIINVSVNGTPYGSNSPSLIGKTVARAVRSGLQSL